MARHIDFYFDFSSPYGYLASAAIEALAKKHDCSLRWRPFLLGAVFKVTNTLPLAAVPLKGSYSLHDMARSARLQRVPFMLPSQFPFGTVTACRAFYWLEKTDPAGAVILAKALFHAIYAEGRDVCPVEQVAAVAARAGFDPEAVSIGMQGAEIKQHLKHVVDAAIARGVFGSPMIFVDEEPFWGSDRLDQVDLWLARGGW